MKKLTAWFTSSFGQAKKLRSAFECHESAYILTQSQPIAPNRLRFQVEMSYIVALATQEDILPMVQEIELPLEDGGVYTWCVAKPQLVLQHLAARSPSLLRCLQRVPNSIEEPWGIVHYHDDVTAGHLLAPSHPRSFTVFRFTFKQFGNHLRGCQQMWIEYAFLRTPICENGVGGMAFIFRLLMHLFVYK